MTIAHTARRAVCGLATACLLWSTLLAALPVSAAADPDSTGEIQVNEASFSVGWLEPLGLNIVDLVGEVPDSFLSGSIVSYTPGYGIVRYESGRRNGNTVTITATAYPRFVVDRGWSGSMFSCLGQGARIDQMGSISPASLLRVYHQGRDVTREVFSISHVPAGKIQPILNPKESEGQNRYRYPETSYVDTRFTADNQLIVPANMGCEMIISLRDYHELTLVFTIDAPQQVDVTLLGTESFKFYSYLGPGFTGLLNSLTQQLRNAGYSFRADRFDMHIPASADYFLLNFPPSPVDPYTAFPENPVGNIDRPTGGTYRVSMSNGLSVDHVNTMGLPIFGHWQDIDQADGAWLNYSNRGVQLSAPEYFVPAGVGYHPCMIQGGCPIDVLKTVYNTPMTMKAAYLRVERVSADLERLPVQMVGSGYRCAPAATESAPASAPDETLAKKHRLFIPGITYQRPALPGDSTAGCSMQGGCGWFAPDGRMVDYIPRP